MRLTRATSSASVPCASKAVWPFYAPRAVEHGAVGMVSLPMASEGKLVGALDIYSRQAEQFTAEDVALGELLATQAGVAMQVAASFFAHRDLAAQMQQALASRAPIERAKGAEKPRRSVAGARPGGRTRPTIDDREPAPRAVREPAIANAPLDTQRHAVPRADGLTRREHGLLSGACSSGDDSWQADAAGSSTPSAPHG